MKSFCLLLALLSAPSWAQDCISVEGRKIDHFDKKAGTGLGKRILVISQIHGDEPQAGVLGRKWIERLQKLPNVSNHWRVIPMLNPDGVHQKTRYNKAGVDLNRNFPTKDWESAAHHQWKATQKQDARRFPGPSAGSEPEVKCALWHLEDFKPDVIISIHTPYGLFDYDGPSHSHIHTKLLPWRRLGTFPGSLGRYMWDERKVPVLTIELRPSTFEKQLQGFIAFQDLVSNLLQH